MLNKDKLLDSLENQGWYTQQNVFCGDMIDSLIKECHSRTMLKASIGHGSKKSINENIRADNISWISNNERSACVTNYLDFIKSLQQDLNQAFYLGLNDFEGHFAQYPEGSFYKPHLDRFKQDGKRVVTLITYLNKSWQKGDGGELCLHLEEGKKIVEPHAGTIVCFLSAKILHEVLMANKERIAITGWFLNNNDIL